MHGPGTFNKWKQFFFQSSVFSQKLLSDQPARRQLKDSPAYDVTSLHVSPLTSCLLQTAIRPPCRLFISTHVFLVFLQLICNLLTRCNSWDYWHASEDAPMACFVRKSVAFGTLTKSHSGVGPGLHSGSLVCGNGQFNDSIFPQFIWFIL